jgi:hypothetical protein
MEENKLHPKVLLFAEAMQRELDDNAHKGDWGTFRKVIEILDELRYHEAKLIIALRKPDNRQECKELIADCGNFLLMLGNAGGVYDIDG